MASARCPAIHPSGERCLLSAGHPGDHEAYAAAPGGWPQGGASPAAGSERTRGPWYDVVSVLLAIWIVAYPVASCSPMFLGPNGVDVGFPMLAAMFLAAVLFVPWVVGLVVLLVLRHWLHVGGGSS